MNESVRYDRCQVVQLDVLGESQVSSSAEEEQPAQPLQPQGTGNVSPFFVSFSDSFH